MRTVKFLVSYAKKVNRKEKIWFPVWGTCLGFEGLLTAFS